MAGDVAGDGEWVEVRVYLDILMASREMLHKDYDKISEWLI